MKAIYHPATSTLSPHPRADGQPVEGLAEGLYEVEHILEPQPSFNPITHGARLWRNWDSQALTVTDSWEVIELEDAALRLAYASGYTVQPEGFVLSVEKHDRDQFTAMVALLREALDFEQITNSTPLQIADKSGALHTITTQRFREIMVGYGFYCVALWKDSKQS